MPILIEELLVEAEPPRSPPEHSAQSPPVRTTGQADRMLELAIIADRHYRIEVD
jgi:hypothetical protein